MNTFMTTTSFLIESTSTTNLSDWQHDVLWALIVGAIIAFFLGIGLGGNDVANAFGTSVGSGVLLLYQAYILATIFEALGSVLVGYSVADSLKNDLINIDIYKDEPKTLLFGQVAILGGTATWLIIATLMKWPISTTQAIVGATVGMSMVNKGFDGIIFKEVIVIGFSWIFAPILSGIISSIVYIIVDHSVLRRKNPFKCGLKMLPIFYFVCLFFNSFVIIYQGSGLVGLKDLSLTKCLLISFFIGLVAMGVVQFVLKPRLTRWINKTTLLDPIPQVKTFNNKRFSNLTQTDNESVDTRTQEFDNTFTGFVKWILPLKDRKTSPRVLKIFGSIQIFTACFAGFAHGANDVSNAISPLSALISIYRTGKTSQNDETPIYVLLYGVLAICIGLWILGHRVIETVGQKMSSINPASGFTIEFGAAVTTLLASKAGLPIATTHSIVGSVVFIGLIRSNESINFKLLRGVIFSWLITLPVAGLISAGLMKILTLFL
uniref:Phosphate transporter n=1 Tax=Rhabditophanes sp. KR3021 TaxID=114890 RepID=A0AC35U4H9_9BILA